MFNNADAPSSGEGEADNLGAFTRIRRKRLLAADLRAALGSGGLHLLRALFVFGLHVTSNLPFEDWTSIFGSERLTGALLDRLTHHVHILEMNGDSYRLKELKNKRRRASRSANTDASEAESVDPSTGEVTSR